jgi:uncharacterized protein (TIGR02453 family)
MKAASGRFKGLPAQGIAFLRDLTTNNNREWFAPRLETYKQQVQAPMLELVRAVHLAMLRFAPAYVSEPAKCLYRIYRDTRFSKDKTPYKTHAAANFWRNNLEKNEGAGFYFAISAKEVAIGGGMYMPSPAVLLAVRQRISANRKLFRATFETKPVRRLLGELQGEGATRVPKGFSAEDPAAELLKHKRFILYTTLSPDIAASPTLLREIVSRFEAMTPFVEFLNQPLVKTPARRP